MHKDRAIKYLAEFPQEPSQEQAEQLLGLRSKPFPRDPLAKKKLELAKELLFQGPMPEEGGNSLNAGGLGRLVAPL